MKVLFFLSHDNVLTQSHDCTHAMTCGRFCTPQNAISIHSPPGEHSTCQCQPGLAQLHQAQTGVSYLAHVSVHVSAHVCVQYISTKCSFVHTLYTVVKLVLFNQAGMIMHFFITMIEPKSTGFMSTRPCCVCTQVIPTDAIRS